MAPSIIIFIIMATLMMISPLKHSSTAAYANNDHRQILHSHWMAVDNCIGDCFVRELEVVDSEISNRRILAGKRYVSYGALEKNNVPCSRRGASYYNCRQGAHANPYTRGCSAITRCRS